MTVSASDLVYSKGLLRTDQFPGENLTAIIAENWLPEAVVKTASVNADFRDEATKDWVYYRGFKSIADRLAGEPDSMDFEGASRTISNSRVEHFENLAQRHLDQFKAAFGTDQTVSKKSGNTTSSRTKVIF